MTPLVENRAKTPVQGAWLQSPLTTHYATSWKQAGNSWLNDLPKATWGGEGSRLREVNGGSVAPKGIVENSRLASVCLSFLATSPGLLCLQKWSLWIVTKSSAWTMIS